MKPWEKYAAKPWERYQGGGEPTPKQKLQASTPGRVVQGMRDPIDASAQLLTHMLPDSVVNAGNKANNWLADKTGLVGSIPEGGMDQLTADNERQYQDARAATGQEGVDFARISGNLVSPANLAVASKIPQGASLAGRIASGAAGGGLLGATSAPVTDGDFWAEKGKQVGTGAVAGGLLSAASAGVSRMVKPKTRPAVTALMDEGITPTPGQILGGRWQSTEDKLTSVPILGDAIASARSKSLDELNTAAYKRALDPIGGKVPKAVGREGIAEVRKQIGAVYDDLLTKVNFQADKQFSQDVSKLSTMASALPDEQAARFEKVLRTQVIGKLGPKGTMDGQTLKGVESELGRIAKGLKGDASFDNRQLGDALYELQTSLRSNLERANPQYANELKAVNTSWANYARLRDAASRQGSADGKFTPAQLSAAVRAQDKTVGKRAFSEGTALLQDLSDAGKGVLAQQYPDSGTTGRALLGVGAGATMAGGTAIAPAVGAPAVAGGILSILPYLPGGRQAMASLLARRPDGAEQAAKVIRQAGPLLAPGAIPLLNQPTQ